MEEATAESVEGRFDGRTLQNFDEIWRFESDSGRFFVALEEPGREPRRWQVAYTFGVEPLQQYLVQFPRGRFQALPVAWDTRTAEEGGQAWFFLNPDERIPRGDPLDWEGIAYNWNSQCAACHSTQLEKGYDEVSDRFDTRFAEIDVGCEACHGPGSRHVHKMAAGSDDSDEDSGLTVHHDPWDPERWQRADGARFATLTSARVHDADIDVCAPCHSRRSQIVDAPEIGAPYLDGHRPQLPNSPLYFDDGQIREEVYVYGSFLQSRMYRAGVRCSDCHEPHSLELRRQGNALCEGCHSNERYHTDRHHGHDPNGRGGECVSCHMPERIYMEVDPRRDHSFLVPRPDREAAMGSPSVCQSCHGDRDSTWSSQQIQAWRRHETPAPHWSDRLVPGTSDRIDANAWLDIALDGNHPALVRAAAWSRVASHATAQTTMGQIRKSLESGSALERIALVEVARSLSPEMQLALLGPLLDDEFRVVRIAAASALMTLRAGISRPADRSRLARALREYRAAQIANAERPESQVNLGAMAMAQGDPNRARVAYERAIALASYFVPAYVNLADLERAVGQDAAAIEHLERALEIAPEEPMVRHALGLALVRVGRHEDALRELSAAARAAPQEPRLTLAWALSLDAQGQRSQAIEKLDSAIEAGRGDADLYHAVVSLLRDSGQVERALSMARQWRDAYPQDERAVAIHRVLSEAG